MRRVDREITEFSEMIAIMRKCTVCRIALHDTPFPYIVPMHFGMEVENEQVMLYLHGAGEGKKLNLLAKNPNVAFEMDCEQQLITSETACGCSMAYESVIGQGKLEIVSDEEKKHGLTALLRQFQLESLPMQVGAIQRTTVLKLTVEQLTGKRRIAQQLK